MPNSNKQADAVRQYYDRNTGLFIRLGKTGKTHNIHRTVWADGVQSVAEAANHVNDRIATELETIARDYQPSPHVLDLGCGVGASLFYLANRVSSSALIGVSISPRQVALATEAARAQGLADRCQFEERDFHDLNGLPRFHLAYAIEAFVHAADPLKLLHEVADRLLPGGRLIICDDFLTPRGEHAQDDDAKRIQAFQQGWLTPGLRSVAEFTTMAATCGLTLATNDDLTPYLELGRPRDKFIAAFVRLIGPAAHASNYLRSLRGGDALQYCLLHGLIQYRYIVLTKGTETPTD